MTPRKKKPIDRFMGRVFWLDVVTHHDYALDTVKNGIDRLPEFVTIGVVDLNDKTNVVVITDIEIDRDGKIKGHRDHTDIPRPLVDRVERHLGGDKWELVKI